MARTTAPGVVTRHSRACRSRDLTPEQRDQPGLVAKACNCDPTYEAWVYSKRDEKKIRRSFETMAAAKGWRIDALKQVRDRRLRAPSPRTLREETEAWLAGARSGEIRNKREQPYKPGVVREYERSLRLRVLPDLGDRKLADIDLADLLELKEHMQGTGCSGSTIRNAFVPLQAIYRRARRNGVVAVNPTVDLGLPTAGKRDRAAAPEQAADLLDALPVLERAIHATAFYAGLRRGEIRGLRVSDVLLDENMISVERGWDIVDGPIAPKSQASTRRVFLLPTLRPHLEPLVAGRVADALVFGYADAVPFEPRAVSRKAERAWDAADRERDEALVRFTLHEARHSFSTWMDHAGVSPDRADRYMGHSSGSVASRYRHLLAAQMTEDARRVDEYLAGATAGKVVALAAAQ